MRVHVRLLPQPLQDTLPQPVLDEMLVHAQVSMWCSQHHDDPDRPRGEAAPWPPEKTCP